MTRPSSTRASAPRGSPPACGGRPAAAPGAPARASSSPRTTRTRDGSGHLFRLITDRSPEAVQAHFEEDYGRPLPLDTVRHVLAGHLLTPEAARSLNPVALSDEDLLRRIAAEPEIGAYLACDGYSGTSNLSSICMFIASRIMRSALASS
ncbi:hypothetical protein EES47_13995 [Streptomyces sp. ADI98-12]|uniref:Uncharacterized protein n=1 Tax=Streptomyces griseus TaxID=1911 RepID=A0A380P6A8_STRGR|nr:hypothetical protein EES47_13995 [Streptomyces sp. ADI98-12]SUP60751.1 Uncharacterised protein [Streptomyces griseus]